MTTIITPELVRRYLKATGWTLGTDEWWTGTNDRGGPGCGFPDAWIARDPLDADVLARVTGSPIGAMRLCARLGMLAAAEDLLERSRSYFAAGDSLLGTSKAADGNRLVAMAGVDPMTWEAAR